MRARRVAVGVVWGARSPHALFLAERSLDIPIKKQLRLAARSRSAARHAGPCVRRTMAKFDEADPVRVRVCMQRAPRQRHDMERRRRRRRFWKTPPCVTRVARPRTGHASLDCESTASSSACACWWQWRTDQRTHTHARTPAPQRWLVQERADGTNVNGWHWHVIHARSRASHPCLWRAGATARGLDQKR